VSRDIQKSFVEQYGFSKERVKMIHNGIRIPQNPLIEKASEPFVIGSSGRFFPVKDYPLMVEISREVVQRRKVIRFELAGYGPERTKIQDLIQKYGLDKKFLLKGFVNNTSAFYQGLDLYLNTSLHEGISMSILEAMAHGTPVVAPKVGGLAEIVEDGIQGYLLRCRDPKAFAEKCLALYENRALRQGMALAARKRVVREFSMENMAKQYFNLYIEVTNDH
jgi:glycosyltransferase involved in cell wall biosynthesis